MGYKVCIDCKENKETSYFYKQSLSRSGFVSYCKECHKKRNKVASQKWQNSPQGKEYIRKHNKDYRQSHKDEYREYSRVYARKYQSSEKGLAQRRIIDARRRSNPQFKVNINFSRALRLALKGNKNRISWVKLVGYSLVELTSHLEKQFDSKMSWDNYGSYWHIDHIRPRSSFSFKTPYDKEFKECWSLKNLQPLEARENIRKSNKWNKL